MRKTAFLLQSFLILYDLMKTLYLDIEYDFDFDVYGIVSPVKEYKLAWALNRGLDIKLAKQHDLCYDMLGRERMIISNYAYSTDFSVVRLFRNKAIGSTTLKKPYLLPEIKEYDYILQITGNLHSLYSQEFFKTLLNSPLVQYVKQFDPRSFKFKENLIF